MTLAQRSRSRFYPKDLKNFFFNASEGARAVNKNVHFAQHSPRTLLYTSTITITTSAGTPWVPTFPGQIVSVRLNVTSAPTGILTAALLINSISRATATIPSGSLSGFTAWPEGIAFALDDSIQWQITTINAAGGPLVAQAQYWPEG